MRFSLYSIHTYAHTHTHSHTRMDTTRIAVLLNQNAILMSSAFNVGAHGFTISFIYAWCAGTNLIFSFLFLSLCVYTHSETVTFWNLSYDCAVYIYSFMSRHLWHRSTQTNTQSIFHGMLITRSCSALSMLCMCMCVNARSIVSVLKKMSSFTTVCQNVFSKKRKK